MKQIYITAAGGPEKLQIRESADPSPAAGELRIRVAASGINFADIMARQGLYPDAPPLPCVVGYEFSGTVDAAGEGVESGWVGKEVFGLTRFGGYSDVLTVPANQIFEKPVSLTHEQAAAIPVNYLTAWQLLTVMGALTKDESVLIQNAGGGVGLAAIDIARHIGATIYGTASEGKHGFLNDRGLHHPIDYRNKDWSAELDKLTDGKGVELITDPLGGPHWRKSYKSLRSTGRLGMFGMSVATEPSLFGKAKLIKLLMGTPFFHPIGLMNENRSVFGVNMGHLWHEVDKIRLWMEVLIQGVEDGWVRPHVDKSFSFEQAGEAQAYIEARKNIGKVVLVP